MGDIEIRDGSSKAAIRGKWMPVFPTGLGDEYPRSWNCGRACAYVACLAQGWGCLLFFMFLLVVGQYLFRNITSTAAAAMTRRAVNALSRSLRCDALQTRESGEG